VSWCGGCGCMRDVWGVGGSGGECVRCGGVWGVGWGGGWGGVMGGGGRGGRGEVVSGWVWGGEKK